MGNHFQRQACSLAGNAPLTMVVYFPVKEGPRDRPRASKKINMVNESDCDELRCAFRITKGPEKNSSDPVQKLEEYLVEKCVNI